jgi:ATP-binding cassette, subfamily B, bacterial PglK
MYRTIKALFSLLEPQQRRQFFLLQIIVIFMTFAEILGIASMVPFMALVGDVEMLQGDNILSAVYNYTGIEDPYDFVFLSGVGVLVFLTFSSLLSIYTTWRLLMYSSNVGTEISTRLYNYYIKQPWLFHASGSSAQLTKQVSVEAVRVTDGVISPLMILNARVTLSFFLSLSIFIYNPTIALTGAGIFIFAYLLLYKGVRKKLQLNGEVLSEASTTRFRLLNEGLGGIKDVLLLGRDQDFMGRFESSSKRFAYARGNTQVLSQVPRYFMELIAFGTMIALVLYLLVAHKDNLGMILPILSVYALAGFKLLPAFQQIYSSVATIKGNIVSFENIKDDLIASKKQNTIKFITLTKEQLEVKENIVLEDIVFTYPHKEKTALKNLNLTIKTNSVIGIVGPSGSGKSTLIDILLGLITPHKGELKIDGVIIRKENLRQWQNSIGFVPQSIFLSEGTIAENIAFGLAKDEMDIAKVNHAIKLSHLDELVSSMQKGIDTKVGERGVQLSGGQRQRIGIARALYDDPSILVFDEATSALDGITEKMIMNAIHDFSGKKTIIMIAHRLKTVERCDSIYFVEDGKIVDSGTYVELIETNAVFRKMAKHA